MPKVVVFFLHIPLDTLKFAMIYNNENEVTSRCQRIQNDMKNELSWNIHIHSIGNHTSNGFNVILMIHKVLNEFNVPLNRNLFQTLIDLCCVI